MAKKAPASEPEKKSIVEKIGDAIDHALHPGADDETLDDVEGSAAGADEMSSHQKFDKFN